MGQKLSAYYEKANALGGAQARVAFVKLVALAASQAEAILVVPLFLEKLKKKISLMINEIPKFSKIFKALLGLGIFIKTRQLNNKRRITSSGLV